MAISDYELQDAIVGVDQSAAAAIPLQTRRGIMEALELRHTGGSWQCLGDVYVSTHPEHWWGIARMLPVEPYAAQVRVVVRLTVADADVDIRARVGMQLSDVETVSAGTTSVVELVVPLPLAREQRVEVLSVEIRSQVGDAIATGLRLTSQWNGNLNIDATPDNLGGASSIYAGAVHTYLLPDTSSGNWSGDTDLYDGMPGLYVGFVAPVGSGSQVYVWPEDTPGAATNPWGAIICDAYELGRALIHGVSWSLEGIVGDPLPAESAFAVNAYMRASDVLAMQAVAAQAYDARPWIWTPPLIDDDGRASGYTCGREIDCLWTYRADTIALEIALLVGARDSVSYSRNVVIAFYDEDGTLLDAPALGTVESSTVARRTGPSQPGTLVSFSAFTSWGGADLLYAGPSPPDWQRLQVFRVTLPLAGISVSVRDTPYVVRVSTSTGSGSGRPRFYGAAIWELTRSEDSP